jgi:tRNA dimethylallyltransferase
MSVKILWTPQALKGLEQVISYLEKEVSLEKAIEEIKTNTRRYAKRQMTWFRKDESIKLFHYQAPPEEMIRHINQLRRK